ncbi:prepilin peptidase [Gallibacterium salpingitidis]|uniref:prepilin peptidase n=1 Tax=Gallibacterium salpingitidis TaxID=505341 RepID=UPI0009ECCE77|nr:A24 family peptidase [Gallibacterium salpingitidis]
MILVGLSLLSVIFIAYLYYLPTWLQNHHSFSSVSCFFRQDCYFHLLWYVGLSGCCYLIPTLWWHSFLYYFLFGFSYLVAYIDYRYQLISVIHCYTLILLALLFSMLQVSALPIEQAILSFTIAFLGSTLCYFLCYFILGKDSFGLGDTLLFSALSLLIAPDFLAYFLLISCIIALMFYVMRNKKSKTLPFAPSLIIAALTIFSSQQFLS